MQKVRSIIFRYLTTADFFNIYKPSGTEEGGGGQGYIDFPVNAVSLDEWSQFFEGASSVICDSVAQGPSWEFPINSIGQTTNSDRNLKIYQRRPQSICISSQRITSPRENRVDAWRPEYGFPEPIDPTNRDSVPSNLLIYLVRTTKNEFWAGWAQNNLPGINNETNKVLQKMQPDFDNDGHSGFIAVNSRLHLNIEDSKHPFIF
jgi:5-methylcytosine-specific restriction protein A